MERRYVSRRFLIRELGYPEALVDRALHSRHVIEFAKKSKGNAGKWVIDLQKFERDYRIGLFD